MCAERLRVAVEANVVRAAPFEGRVTISVGLASRMDSVNSAHELLKGADEAVYAAKAAGRNLVRGHKRRLPESA
jgi:diguanylate cyclase (GGDEF)-like protein